MNKIVEYFAGAHEEFKKISWPHRDDVTRYTFVTVLTIFIVAMFLWLVDSFLSKLIALVMG